MVTVTGASAAEVKKDGVSIATAAMRPINFFGAVIFGRFATKPF
jgi:hypothetical protein